LQSFKKSEEAVEEEEAPKEVEKEAIPAAEEDEVAKKISR